MCEGDGYEGENKEGGGGGGRGFPRDGKLLYSLSSPDQGHEVCLDGCARVSLPLSACVCVWTRCPPSLVLVDILYV